MAYQEVADGNAFELANLDNYEGYFGEGDKGLLEVDLRLPVTEGVAQTLEEHLRNAGVEGVRVTTASPLLRIYFRKGFPWLAVIAATLLGLVVLAVLVVGWRLYKDVVPEGLEGIGLIIIGLTILTAFLFVSRRRK